MSEVSVECQRTADGWRCAVTVGDDAAATRHEVSLTDEVLRRLAPGAVEPDGLMHASFGFLLEREPRESILRSFELPVIGRYFPEYEMEIRRRLPQ